MKRYIRSSIQSANDKVYRQGGLSLNQYMKKYNVKDDLDGLKWYYKDEVDPDEYPTFIQWIKARRAEQDDLIQFIVGNTYSCSQLYGGTANYKVVDRTDDTIYVVESHISEDTGDVVESDAVDEYPIVIQDVYDESYDNVIGKQESAPVWEYRGHKGYLYAE